jgi:hypothetical protein
MTRVLSRDGVRPTNSQKLCMRTMLRSLIGEIDFNRLCLGIEIGTLDEDALQIVVPAENCAADIKLHHSDDFAVAAEYAIGRPIRTVSVLSADQLLRFPLCNKPMLSSYNVREWDGPAALQP